PTRRSSDLVTASPLRPRRPALEPSRLLASRRKRIVVVGPRLRPSRPPRAVRAVPAVQVTRGAPAFAPSAGRGNRTRRRSTRWWPISRATRDAKTKTDELDGDQRDQRARGSAQQRKPVE